MCDIAVERRRYWHSTQWWFVGFRILNSIRSLFSRRYLSNIVVIGIDSKAIRHGLGFIICDTVRTYCIIYGTLKTWILRFTSIIAEDFHPGCTRNWCSSFNNFPSVISISIMPPHACTHQRLIVVKQRDEMKWNLSSYYRISASSKRKKK